MSLAKSLYGVYKNPQCNWECCLSVVLSAQDTLIPNLQDGAYDEDNSVKDSRISLLTIRKSIHGFRFLSSMSMGLRLVILRVAGAPLLFLNRNRMKCGVSQEFYLPIKFSLFSEHYRLL